MNHVNSLKHEEARSIRWCVQVIRHAAVRARMVKARQTREVLFSQTHSSAEEDPLAAIPCPTSSHLFAQVEMDMIFHQLPFFESVILYGMYEHGYTQQEIAAHLQLTQQQVSRLHQRALHTLRTMWWNA
ncbi:MAG: hypothetical protein OWR52_13955 [Acidibacillus sp.]|nr:hypothetical protein [Acidibacillus sp.]